VFGTPGRGRIANVTYSSADGIQESPVVRVSSDEPVRQADGTITQNLWVATNQALYLLRPGDKSSPGSTETMACTYPVSCLTCHDKIDYMGPGTSSAHAERRGRPNRGSARSSGEAPVMGISAKRSSGTGASTPGRERTGRSADPWRHSGKPIAFGSG